MLIVSLISVFGRDYVEDNDPNGKIVLGLLLTYIMNIQNSLTWALKGFMSI